MDLVPWDDEEDVEEEKETEETPEPTFQDIQREEMYKGENTR